jgi:hypothetical protein
MTVATLPLRRSRAPNLRWMLVALRVPCNDGNCRAISAGRTDRTPVYGGCVLGRLVSAEADVPGPGERSCGRCGAGVSDQTVAQQLTWSSRIRLRPREDERTMAADAVELGKARLVGNETIATPYGAEHLEHSFPTDASSTLLWDVMDSQRGAQV